MRAWANLPGRSRPCGVSALTGATGLPTGPGRRSSAAPLARPGTEKALDLMGRSRSSARRAQAVAQPDSARSSSRPPGRPCAPSRTVSPGPGDGTMRPPAATGSSTSVSSPSSCGPRRPGGSRRRSSEVGRSWWSGAARGGGVAAVRGARPRGVSRFRRRARRRPRRGSGWPASRCRFHRVPRSRFLPFRRGSRTGGRRIRAGLGPVTGKPSRREVPLGCALYQVPSGSVIGWARPWMSTLFAFLLQRHERTT